MHQTSILVVENDPGLRRFIKTNLAMNNYDTFTAMDGQEALKTIEKELPDLAMIDVELGDLSGLELCRKLREWSNIPIVMIGVNSETKQKTACLNAGADDFISIPFDMEEMLAHLSAIWRRFGNSEYKPAQASFYSGNLEIRFTERRVLVDDQEIQLTPTEYRLLQELALNANKVLTHTVLLRKIWGPQYGQEREYLRIFVGRLRKKLNWHNKNQNYIVTVPWVGYKLSQNCQSNDGAGKPIETNLTPVFTGGFGK
jgi:two-component system, OmpR family, KDP operon response regulator KdpE